MRRIANFIVNKRFIILGIMLLITIVCGILATQVNINTDMSKYLPDDSSMKQGIDVMEEEFPDAESVYTIRVMFNGLDDNQITTVQAQLEEIQYVDSVDYDSESSDYNKDSYTLFVVNTYHDYGSEEEKSIETAIQDNFTAYDVTLKNDSTPTSIPLWIIVFAISLAMIILIVMCKSWVEPFILLTAIGIAVVLNMGTSFFFESVSNTTYSIGAILQLVLSMDYSIILMNRYRQESKLTDNKTEAMKAALTNAFSSIIGSAMTTIVGLLMLVFMSFKIGQDIGVFLAKGVALSMITIFTILPGLILLLDNVIRKTSKKDISVPMNKAANFSFRSRRFLAAGFVILFVGAFFFQGMTKAVFTLNNDDPIADIFPKTNTIVMLYDNGDEDKAAEIAEQLKGKAFVKGVVCYSETIGKPYSAAGLANAIKDMSTVGSSITIEPYMLDILYYDYYAKGKTYPITAGDFLQFIANGVAANETFSEQIGADTKSNIDKIKKFSNEAALTRLKNASELADYFDMKSEDAEQLLLYYFTRKSGVNAGTMTLPSFSNFVVNDVAADKDYASMFDSPVMSQMKTLSNFTNVSKMTATISYPELAKLLGMEQEQMKMLFVYYYGMSSSYTPSQMTLPVFTQFVLNDAANNRMFAGQFDKSALAQMEMLSAYTDKSIVQKQMTSAEIADLLGMDQSMVYQLFGVRFGGSPEGKTMSPEEFIDFMLADVITNEAFAGQLDQGTIRQLTFLRSVIKASLSGTAFDYSGLAQMLGMDSNMMKMLYTCHDSYGNTDSWRLSAQTVVNFIVDNSGQFEAMLSSSVLTQLKAAAKTINGSVAGTKYTTTELAELVGAKENQIYQLYLLYASKYGDTSGWKMSPQDFLNFIISDVLPNKDFSDKFSAGTADDLKTAKTVIDAVISAKAYTAKELTGIISGLSGELTGGNIELIYLYYASLHNSDPTWKLSIMELFDYLSEDIMNDPLFDNVFSEALRNDIIDMKDKIDDAIRRLKGNNYSLLMLSTTLADDSDETSEFIAALTEMCDSQLSGDYYLVGNSPMSYEIESNFDNEMLLITLLTAISIFIVVALTFRSFSIPLILVLIVQCAIYITIAVNGLFGYSIYYLALLIVQCILMGATIDYGILFTNYYREQRQTMDVKGALTAAYSGSIHTIMSSGLILILVTGVIGFIPVSEMSISEICRVISMGTLTAVLLILFVLPSLLVTSDRFVVGKKGRSS